MKTSKLFLFLGLILMAKFNYAQKKSAEKPNIVLIMADDMGYGDLGCYGNEDIKTPNIDKLAENSLKFTDFHSNGAVCTPTRAALLTGNYQQRSGLEGVIYVRGETRETGLDTDSTTTIAELLKSNGYATGIMGKWHLGYKEKFNPVNQGFDEFYGYLSGNVDYHSHYDNSGIYDWWHNLDSIQEKGYSTDLITQHSVDFINAHKKEPFFLYVPQEAPHAPFQGRNDPAYRFPNTEFSYYGNVKDSLRAYKEMIEVMDEGVGKIMSALKKNDLEKNTLVIFLSDNGSEVFGNNGVLRGDKGSLYEGGHRVPALAYWKGKIKSGKSSETLLTMDFLPTFLAITDTQPPEKIKFDGVDFTDVLFNRWKLKKRPVFWRYRGQKVVREKEWKLFISKRDTALYNLDMDIRETNNLSKENPEKVKDLAKKLTEWEKISYRQPQ